MRISRLFLFSLSVSLLLRGITAPAETFRVRATIPIALSEPTTEIKTTATMNDALSITLPKDMTYVSGIELRFKIPELVAAWRDTIAYSLYDGITPRPTEQTVDYEGTRISVNTFPGKLSHIVYIPLSENIEIKQSPYHDKIAVIPDTRDGTVFFRMQLAMKGVPEDFENAIFDVTAKPVLLNKGKLNLTITEPDGAHNAYTVTVDEKPFTGDLLAVGEHHLSITSDEYRNEVRTFRIEQAKTTTLTVPMRGIEPSVKIIAPENAQVFFDGEPVTNAKDEMTITQGDHTVRFVIGEYEVVRTVSVVNGRTYTVNLSVDAVVTEDSGEQQE